MNKDVKLQQIVNECMDELDAIGIQYGYVNGVDVNTRARKRWGQCCKKGKAYNLNISSVLLDDRVPINSLKSTVMHELLHTCDGAFNHGKTWQRLADKVNTKYGYNIKRCTDANEKGIGEFVNEINKPKYVFVCEDCGQEVKRFRESKFTKNYSLYRCGRCQGKFKRIY